MYWVLTTSFLLTAYTKQTKERVKNPPHSFRDDMMRFQKIRVWTIRLILGYLIIGSVYYVSSFFLMLITGKDIVFSPIIGYPLTLMGWPWMVYADLIHHQTLGLRLPTTLTLISAVAFLIYIFHTIVKH